MQLHYENTIENYFKNKREMLGKEGVSEKSLSGQPTLVTYIFFRKFL